MEYSKPFIPLIKEHKKTQPIGVFDSGIGGLTVANAIISHLPQEEIIYFGDTAHLPYGDKSADAIRYYSLKIVKFLLEQKCKMIVIACNSASAAAYKVLLDFYEGQALFVNVVDPLVEAVASNNYKKVGIIATKATISSGIYKYKLQEAKPSLQVESLATPLLAPMIEEGYFNNNISDAVIEKYLSNPIFENIDALLLACTHYPLIRKNIEDYFQQKVKVYDSTNVVAHAVRKRLQEFDLLNDEAPKAPKFFVSDYTPSFAETTQIFYKEKIELEYCPIW
ncbi:MAG: glutamate racemase [Saprospiraceae bacterium]